MTPRGRPTWASAELERLHRDSRWQPDLQLTSALTLNGIALPLDLCVATSTATLAGGQHFAELAPSVSIDAMGGTVNLGPGLETSPSGRHARPDERVT